MSAAALRLLGHSGLRIIRSRHRFSAVLQAGAGVRFSEIGRRRGPIVLLRACASDRNARATTRGV